MFNKFLDTINKIIAILAFLGINGYLIKEYLVQIVNFLKENYLEIIILEFILILILIIIVYFLFKRLRNPDNGLQVNYKGILNRQIFEKFLEDRKKLFSSKLSQLQKGYIRLYGKEVKEVQVSLIDYLEEPYVDSKIIRTVDLTINPALWLTREEYIKKNKHFIENGGRIYRILAIDFKKLQDRDFKNSLIKLCSEFLEIDVNLKLCNIEELSSEEKEDFIIYDTFAVLVENKQADKEYKIASSTLFFDKENFNRYYKLFESVNKKSKIINSIETCEKLVRKEVK